jgi:hypothetical protein
VAIRLGFGADDFGYATDLGLPPPDQMTAFSRDRRSSASASGPGPCSGRRRYCATGSVVTSGSRADDGEWSAPVPIREYDSMLSEFADPQRAPELLGHQRYLLWTAALMSPRPPGVLVLDEPEPQQAVLTELNREPAIVGLRYRNRASRERGRHGGVQFRADTDFRDCLQSEPAPRPAAGARSADRRRFQARAGDCRVAFGGADRSSGLGEAAPR